MVAKASTRVGWLSAAVSIANDMSDFVSRAIFATVWALVKSGVAVCGRNSVSKGISATIPFLLASMAIMGQPAIAEDYPLRPITVIGTTPAGTSVDLTTRFFGERVKAKTGQPWVVENKPGAAGSIAAKAAASARPDGYTLFMCTSGALSAEPYPAEEAALRSGQGFQLVARLFRLDFALMVNPEKTPVKTVAELTEFLKAKKGSVSFGYFSASMQALAEQYLPPHRHQASPAAYRNPAADDDRARSRRLSISRSPAREYSLKPIRSCARWRSRSEKRSTLLPDVPTRSRRG